jgi:ABC-type oligopeptide transport system ATPase subunit
MLELARVTKVFKTGMFGKEHMTAVSDVSFTVQPGEVISLIGESGSGKTTVGRMILRLTGATAGSITFDGRDVAGFGRGDLRHYYADVQGVFQDPFSSYNPVYKVDRVLGMIRSSYLTDLGADEWKTKLRKSLEAVSLTPSDVLGKYPHQLSGGQLQRLMIARALLLDIKFLVADEIISMLDASTRIDVLNLLGDLKERGVGILFITHDLSLGNYISDRTIILRRGCVVEMGATPKVFGNPVHPYTQMLLSAVPQLHSKWAEGSAGAAGWDHEVSNDAAGPLVEVEPDHLVASDEGMSLAGAQSPAVQGGENR